MTHTHGQHVTGFATLALAAGLLAATPRSGPAAGDRLSFRQTEQLPTVSLRLNTFSDAVQSPLPPPKSFTYTRTRGTQNELEERYAPIELWRHAQTAAHWLAPDGSLLIATLQTAPLAFPQTHVTRETYDAVLAAARTTPSEQWSADQVKAWVAAYAGEAIADITPVKSPPSQLAPVIAYRFRNTDTPCIAYLFRFNPRVSGQQSAPATWFCALFHFRGGSDPAAAAESVETTFLPSIAFVRPSRSSGGSATLAGLERQRDSRGDGHSTAYNASVADVIAGIRNMQDWWHLETDHYVILSNLRRGVSALVNELQSDMEIMRDAYERYVPAQQPVDAVSVIRVFATSDEYVAYVGTSHAWTGGLWMPDRRELVIRPAERRRIRDSRDATMRTVYHEAFHQYVFYSLGQLTTAPWFNEGHACFFECADLSRSRKKVDIEENPAFADLLDGLATSPAARNLAGFMQMDYDQFYAGSDAQRKNNYALAWALVYYLRKGAPLEREHRFADLPDRYVEILCKSGDPKRATQELLAAYNMKALSEAFTAFWSSRSKRSAARRAPLREKPTTRR